MTHTSELISIILSSKKSFNFWFFKPILKIEGVNWNFLVFLVSSTRGQSYKNIIYIILYYLYNLRSLHKKLFFINIFHPMQIDIYFKTIKNVNVPKFVARSVKENIRLILIRKIEFSIWKVCYTEPHLEIIFLSRYVIVWSGINFNF